MLAVAELLANYIEEVMQPEGLLDQAVGAGPAGRDRIGRLTGQDQDPHLRK